MRRRSESSEDSRKPKSPGSCGSAHRLEARKRLFPLPVAAWPRPDEVQAVIVDQTTGGSVARSQLR
jgi:hypothetical protein